MTDTELLYEIANIIHARTMENVDYRMIGDNLYNSDKAAADIIRLLKERGLLAVVPPTLFVHRTA